MNGRLSTIEDVEVACLVGELHRVTGEDVHPHAWMSEPHGGMAVAVAVAAIGFAMTGVQIQLIDVETEQAEPLVTVHPYTPGSADQLSSAICVALEQLP